MKIIQEIQPSKNILRHNDMMYNVHFTYLHNYTI